MQITEKLLSLQDERLKEFSKKIIPDTKKPILGVKIPKIREVVKSVPSLSDSMQFLKSNHTYFEEFMAHGLLIARFGVGEEGFAILNEFLPQIDNWAVCDTTATSIKKLAKNKNLLWQNVNIWLQSDKIYTVRFAIVCLLAHFTDKEYYKDVIRAVLSIKSEEYYINMAIAWLLSVLLVKNYDETVILIKNKILPRFIQNKTIDKARDSFRIAKDKKEYLKTLKI